MTDIYNFSLIVMYVGVVIFFSITLKSIFYQFRLAPIAAFMALGWILRLCEAKWGFLPKDMEGILKFLGEIGIVTILFHIGLDSHLRKLAAQLGRASFFVICEILISGGLAFYCAHSFMSVPFVQSLFITVALTATSLGVVVTIWKESRKIQSENGQLLIDLSALDDVIGIILMVLLLAITPYLGRPIEEGFSIVLLKIALITILKFSLFVFVCFLFSLWVEPWLVSLLRKFEISPDPVVTILSIGFIIAGIAGILGFSLALGAFFAGLAFSRDPKKAPIESPLKPLEVFFAPFFFLHIGFQVYPGALSEASSLSGLLLFFAIAGKVIGIFIPALISGFDLKSTFLLGMSMVPRAEITLVVMAQGAAIGVFAFSPHVYASIVIVSFFTCLITPIVLRPFLE